MTRRGAYRRCVTVVAVMLAFDQHFIVPGVKHYIKSESTASIEAVVAVLFGVLLAWLFFVSDDEWRQK